jgi:hypothetical protein
MRIPLPDKGYPTPERRAAFFRDLLDRIRTTRAPIELTGAAVQDRRVSLIHQVNSDYLKALGIPLLQGRRFDETEICRSPACRAGEPRR